VLIVDDNADAADSLAFLVDALGHESRVAYEARGAISITHAFEPEVALLDIGLPGDMDGYALAAQLRKAPFGPGLHLVAITGWGQPKDQRRASEAGFDRHYTKPVEPAVLEALLNSLSDRPAAGSVAGANPASLAQPANGLS
jgi:CheY-like chemotaxis protein